MKKGTDNCCVDGYLSDKKIYRITEIQNIATQEQVKLDFGELQLTAKEHESTFDEWKKRINHRRNYVGLLVS